MTWLRLLFLSLVINLIPSLGIAATPVSLAPHLLNATAAIMLTNDEGDTYPMCTAVWVGEHKLLTAAHCVESYRKHHPGNIIPISVQSELTKIGDKPLTTHNATVEKTNHFIDLALLSVADTIKHEVSPIGTSLPDVGETVELVGHPEFHFYSFSVGIVSAYRESLPADDLDHPFMQIQATVGHGQSGGGVWNTDGKLVGIFTMLTPVNGMAMCIPITIIRAFLA